MYDVLLLLCFGNRNKPRPQAWEAFVNPLHYVRSMLSVGNAQSVRSAAIQSRCTMHSWGTWCSGITSAPHAEGPGLKSQCVHCFPLASRDVCTCHHSGFNLKKAKARPLLVWFYKHTPRALGLDPANPVDQRGASIHALPPGCEYWVKQGVCGREVLKTLHQAKQ